MKHPPRRTPLLGRPMTDARLIAKCACEDAREVSRRIVKLIWIVFVLLPMVLGILFVILKL